MKKICILTYSMLLNILFLKTKKHDNLFQNIFVKQGIRGRHFPLVNRLRNKQRNYTNKIHYHLVLEI